MWVTVVFALEAQVYCSCTQMSLIFTVYRPMQHNFQRDNNNKR